MEKRTYGLRAKVVGGAGGQNLIHSVWVMGTVSYNIHEEQKPFGTTTWTAPRVCVVSSLLNSEFSQ